jgi:NAD(P)-dependent dehydrogenase (short-subunit alcohol dehydrogenase family)
MDGSRIFITGGASGLGRALAERYARAGWRVLVGDINDEGAQATVDKLVASGATAARLSCDVRREADLEAAARWLEAEWGGVDVVVNNAGVALAGGIGEMSLADWNWIVDINLLGVVRGCRVFTPLFKRQRRGHFVNVASMAGLVHPPFMSAYTATKAAVVAMSESIMTELAPDGISVSVVCPAFFRTGLHETMRATTPELEASTKNLVGKAMRSAEQVAELVFDGVARKDFYILTHAEGRLAWMVKRLTPFPTYRRFIHTSARYLQWLGRNR